MKIGMGLPVLLHSTDYLFEWIKRIDSAPFSTLAICDRIVYDNYDALLTLAAAAALSRRVRLMTDVLVTPLRNTALLAKEIATLDALSGGRVTLGMGIGVRKDDFAVTDTSYKERGKYHENQIEQMKRIWSRQDWNNTIGPIGPAPIQKPGPELILGGFVPQVMQRVARYANGFVAATNEIDRVSQAFRAVEHYWQEAGRTGKPRLLAQIDIALESHMPGQGRENALAYYKVLPPPYNTYKAATLITTEQQLRKVLNDLEQIGTDEVICFPWSTEIEQIVRVATLC
ncbi:LLM class flavin-dependent oxidoreductase [Dictyobacter kobayashii]|uniref:Luciferase n=1 Tax=Dictyobacter kobayashii TaxID=2014872 RepID=A0A402AKZ7_9CHLR|nr:LLM class flavin-dependent oxidoreductase [Dictyobacter kobayashii]GCE19797.1 luciferase [Dictyobacter kobayashii]